MAFPIDEYSKDVTIKALATPGDILTVCLPNGYPEPA